MLTIDEIRAIPLFSTLAQADLERLAQTSADMHLGAGEFAVHEGGECALFAVLAGKIEVVKLIDGIERTLGWRVPGTIFGEVPIALGTPFPGGYRASRALARHAGGDAAILRHRGRVAGSRHEDRRARARAHRRAAGHRRRAAEGAPDHGRAPLGQRLQRLAPVPRAQPDHLRLDDPRFARAADDMWPGARPPDSDCPVLRLADGTVVSRPKARELARLLGLQTSARFAEYDTMIIGGGPAGLAAAVYGASEGLRTVVVEREAPGGQAGTSSRIENYLGFPSGVSGDELASRALQQARRLGAEILVTRSITGIDPATREVFLDGDEVLRARTVILATGVTWRRLAIEGFDRLIGKGVYYGASRSEAGAHPRARHPPDRRRQLGRPGGFALRQPCPHGDARGPRRRAGEEHVALPDRAAPRQIQHRGQAAVGSAGGPRRRAPDRDRHSRCRRARRCAGTTAVASSSSSAPTRRPDGCRPKSRATHAAMC